MFYDAYGARLFVRITELPEYYLRRTKLKILADSAETIIAAARNGKSQPVRVLELGAGTASQTDVLLDAVVSLQGAVLYMPVDVSPDALDIARERTTSLLSDVCGEPIVPNYVTHPPQLKSFEGTTLTLYLGSSIGNFSPDQARTILQNLSSQLQSGDALLLGTDMAKDESILLAAYDDRDGITAEFNTNILSRLNRELDADFDPTTFRGRAVWNRLESRIEMHLESVCSQRVHIAAARVSLHFAAGETIHTENSCKFTSESIRDLLGAAGFDVEQNWTDGREWYAVTLARLPLCSFQDGNRD